MPLLDGSVKETDAGHIGYIFQSQPVDFVSFLTSVSFSVSAVFYLGNLAWSCHSWFGRRETLAGEKNEKGGGLIFLQPRGSSRGSAGVLKSYVNGSLQTNQYFNLFIKE